MTEVCASEGCSTWLLARSCPRGCRALYHLRRFRSGSQNPQILSRVLRTIQGSKILQQPGLAVPACSVLLRVPCAAREVGGGGRLWGAHSTGSLAQAMGRRGKNSLYVIT